jgi:hypothetical protein
VAIECSNFLERTQVPNVNSIVAATRRNQTVVHQCSRVKLRSVSWKLTHVVCVGWISDFDQLIITRTQDPIVRCKLKRTDSLAVSLVLGKLTIGLHVPNANISASTTRREQAIIA